MQIIRHITAVNFLERAGAWLEQAEAEDNLGSKIHGYRFFASSVGCTHWLELATTEWEENTWPYLLRSEGEALLREAVEQCQ